MATSAGFWSESDYGGLSAGYSLLNARSPNRYHLSRLLRKRNMRVWGEVLATLLGDATPTTSASVTVTQVDAAASPGGTNSQGGVRGTTANETVDLLLNKNVGTGSANTTRAVSAADVTAMLTEVLPAGARANRAPGTYATDASGNGGGGKMDAGR